MTDELRLLRDPTRDARRAEVPVHHPTTGKAPMAGQPVAIIRHGEEDDRLRLSASGKLILTK